MFEKLIGLEFSQFWPDIMTQAMITTWSLNADILLCWGNIRMWGYVKLFDKHKSSTPMMMVVIVLARIKYNPL